VTTSNTQGTTNTVTSTNSFSNTLGQEVSDSLKLTYGYKFTIEKIFEVSESVEASHTETESQS
jgi:hypothetical protein